MPIGDTCQILCHDREKASRLVGRAAEVAGVAEVFRILGDETRTKIVHLLSLEELCVCDLAHLLGASVSAVSHQLRLLRSYRLVKCRREGKMIFYSLDDEHVSHLIGDAREHLAEAGK